MKPKTWHKHHKWLGLLLGPFVILFCISGIVLNHRRQWASTDISRAWLPTDYRYDNYNNGLVRGTIDLPDSSTLIYGNAGISASLAAMPSTSTPDSPKASISATSDVS